ncbi:MAG TPA: FlgB family protein [Rhodobacterales bacterium]|nr:FlgB family protein [Rhodobacterales bacterium]
MFEKLELFSMAQAMAKHAAARQSVIAQNVANADTPGYRARDIAAFAESYRSAGDGGMRATRPGHVFAGKGPYAPPQATTALRPEAAAPNGNNVSIEQEIFAAAEANSEHDRALAIYKSAMTILRTAASGRG